MVELLKKLSLVKALYQTGASNDIERATDIARKMVTQWGLSEKLGPMKFADEQGEVFLGGGSSQAASMSADTAKMIDDEIRFLIESNYQRAEKILNENMDVLHTMKDALMKYETIDAKQIDDLMERVEVREPADWGEILSEKPKEKEVKKEAKVESTDESDSDASNS